MMIEGMRSQAAAWPGREGRSDDDDMRTGCV